MKLTVLTILLLLSSLVIAQKQSNQNEDPVIAEVNGNKILQSELVEYHNQNLKFVAGNKKVTKESSLNDLINKIIGVERAKKNKIDKDPKVVQKMNDILYHAQISKDLEKDLMKIKVTDSEVEKYYKENPEYRTAQILYRLQAVPDAEEVSTGQDQITKIYNEVAQKPDSFMEIANRFSQSSSALLGGDLGYQPKTRLTPTYYEQIKGKKVGTILKPFRTQFGWHVVKILGVKEYEQIDPDMYKKIIYDIKRDNILEDYFANLRKQAKVKVNKKVLESL